MYDQACRPSNKPGSFHNNRTRESSQAAKRRFRNLIAIVGAGLTLTACADLFTVGRVTEIPSRGTSETQPARAIHLDAQQRLVIATAQGYCAEPSPDAIAAYATALGFDLDLFGQNPASLTQALKNDAASIGLRTQSVTLMRDILYRMCEASHNGHLSDTEVTAFLRRSQDLIAVVLAIEQLTDAVAAKQAILTPSAEASASANLVSNHQLLDQMEKDVQEKEKDVAEKKEVVEEKKAAVNDAQSKLDEATDSKKQEAERAFSEAEEQVKTAEDELEAAKKRLKEAKKVRDTIKALRDAALANAKAETTGTGQSSPVIRLNPLSGRATEAVADAVENMVKKVLNKSDMPDVCLSYLINSEKEIKKIQEQANQAIKAISAIGKIEAIKAIPENLTILEQIKQAKQAIEKNSAIGANKKIQAIQDIHDIRKNQEPAIQKIKDINKFCLNILKTSMRTNGNERSANHKNTNQGTQ